MKEFYTIFKYKKINKHIAQYEKANFNYFDFNFLCFSS